MTIIEVPPTEVAPGEGYVGNLTPEQEDKLREMWRRYFEVRDKATGTSTGGKGNLSDDDGADMRKNAPKGDAAREEAKIREEQAGLDALLKAYGPDSLKKALWEFVKMDNPDGIFLRFLRARKWDVSRALAMFAACLKWRLDNDVESLVRGGDLENAKITKFLEQQRSGKTYALGNALNESPVCFIHVRKHFTFAQPGTSMQKYVIYAMESFRLLMMPPGDKVVLFFDLGGFGLRNMDWNCVLFILKCLESFYPESLLILYIHNAPWIFNGIWKILAPLLDPVVRAKIKFTKTATDVSERVPAERLIEEFDGEVTNGFKFIEPEEGENDRTLDEKARKEYWDRYIAVADQYEAATHEWIADGGKDPKIADKRVLLFKKLRVAQFEMEPYIRGLTVYHRDGTIDGQGKVTWNYKQKNGDVIHHVIGRKTCVATLRREIKEIEAGSTSAEAEARSYKALKEKDWVGLYGDAETAKKLEGDDAVAGNSA